MTRGKYLDLLEKHLSSLPRKRIHEIIADIYTHFDEGLDSGLSEDEIVNGLGTAEDVAAEYLEHYAAERSEEESPSEEPRADGAWGRAPSFRLFPTEERYVETWKTPFSADMDLSIDLQNVHLVLKTHEKNELEAEFDGWRVPDQDGRYPYIEFSPEEKSIRFRQVQSGNGEIGRLTSIFGVTSRMRGTLTITSPSEIGVLDTQVTSGRQVIESLLAKKVEIAGTSGGVEVRKVTSRTGYTLTTHSGAQRSTLIVAVGACKMGATSGSIAVEGIRGESLEIEGHSGGSKVQDVDVIDAARITSTSGSITIDGVRSASLCAQVHSGGATVENAKCAGEMLISSTSGSIRAKNLEAGALSLSSNSGSINLTRAAVSSDASIQTTSGGMHVEEIDAKTLLTNSSSGGKKLMAVRAQSFTAQGSSGSLYLQLMREANVEVRSSSGSVEVRMPADSSIEYHIETSSGGIEVGFDKNNANRSKRSAQGVVGTGACMVKINTSSGRARLMPN